MSVRATLFHHISSLSRVRKRRVFLIVDVTLALLAFLIAPIFLPDFGNLRSMAFFAALSGIAAVASTAVGLPRIKLNAYGRHAVLATAQFASLVMLGMFALCQISKISVYPVSIAEFGMLLFFSSFVGRYTMLVVLLWVLRHGQTRCRVLIYGAGDTGLQMAIALRNHQRILPVAFLDDDPELQAVTVAGLPVLPPERLETALSDLDVDRVLLAMPSASASKLAVITRKLLALGLHVQALPSFAQLAGTEAVVAVETTDLQGQFLGRDAVVCDLPKLDSVYAGKVVLVTGAGGSVGSELCRQLITHKPKTLVLFERSEIALYTVDRELRDLAHDLKVQIVPVLGSVTDALLAYTTMVDARVEVVFHAAAYKHVPLVEANPVAGLANNFVGTRTFAEAAVSAGVAQFVLISTDKAVRPASVMGATKRLAELVVQDLANRSPGTRFSIVRFGNVMGSSGSVLPLFQEQIARGGPITLTHEDVTRYFMTLAEAARLVLLSDAFSQMEGLCNIFVLDMGRPVRIRDLAERMIKAQGLRLKSHDSPAGDIEIVITGLRRGEKLHEEPLISGRSWPTPHPKILRAQEVGLSEFAMASALNAARVAIQAGDQLAARVMIGAWVEGFPQAALGRPVIYKDRNEQCSA